MQFRFFRPQDSFSLHLWDDFSIIKHVTDLINQLKDWLRTKLEITLFKIGESCYFSHITHLNQSFVADVPIFQNENIQYISEDNIIFY